MMLSVVWKRGRMRAVDTRKWVLFLFIHACLLAGVVVAQEPLRIAGFGRFFDEDPSIKDFATLSIAQLVEGLSYTPSNLDDVDLPFGAEATEALLNTLLPHELNNEPFLIGACNGEQQQPPTALSFNTLNNLDEFTFDFASPRSRELYSSPVPTESIPTSEVVARGLELRLRDMGYSTSFYSVSNEEVGLLAREFTLQEQPSWVICPQDVEVFPDEVPPNLFQDIEFSETELQQKYGLGNIPFYGGESVIAQRYLQLDPSALSQNLEEGFSLYLTDREEPVPFVVDSVDVLGSGLSTLTGHTPGSDLDSSLFLVRQQDEEVQLLGEIYTDGRSYSVRSLEGGETVVSELDPASFSDDFDTDPEPGRGESSIPERQNLPLINLLEGPIVQVGAPTPVIDVLLLYTQPVADYFGAESTANFEFDAAELFTNGSFSASHIDAKVRIVHRELTSLEETGSPYTMRQMLLNPCILEVQRIYELRDRYEADVVALLIEEAPDGYHGRAEVMDDMSTDFAKEAFLVATRASAISNATFAHELGHLMGARHDWRSDDQATLFTINHAHIDAEQEWRTIMGTSKYCKQNGKPCKRIWYWSNPDLQYEGNNLGISVDQPEATDNRRVINRTAPIVAQFSTVPLPQCSE